MALRFAARLGRRKLETDLDRPRKVKKWTLVLFDQFVENGSRA